MTRATESLIAQNTALTKENQAQRDGYNDLKKLYLDHLKESETELDALAEQVAELQAENERLRKELRQAQAQRNTAYGYGSDAGKPPWMR